MTKAIEVVGLTKRYGSVVALEDVSFCVEAGTVVALVGPNGAGKSTLFRLLSTLIRPTSGTALIQGHDIQLAPQAVRQRIGAVFTDTALYSRLTTVETLRYFGRLYQIPSTALQMRINELLHIFRLREYADRPVETLSRGLRQKLVIARAIMHAPEVLFLDEPTTGLDIQASRDTIDFISSYACGRTILFATHNLTEIELLCDVAIVLDNGHISSAPIPVKALSSGELQKAIFERIGGWHTPRLPGRSERGESEDETADDLGGLRQGDARDIPGPAHPGDLGVHPYHDDATDHRRVHTFHRQETA